MAFCPECKYEFVKGIDTCPDCQVELVDALPDEYHPDINWVELHRFPGSIYAEMLKEALENNNIRCLLRKDPFSSAYSIQGTESGGLETTAFVPEYAAGKAKTILDQILKDT
jgi:hypothetical protein